MDLSVLLGCVLIFLARVADVSLDTLRMVQVIRGHRALAWVLGFLQVLIWIFAVAHVMKHITEPAYAISYALGFATGNFLGITIERWLAHGDQVIRVFTTAAAGDAMAHRLRGHGYGVTVFDGRGKDGPVAQLFIEATRRRVSEAARLARQMDPACFYVIDDVRVASTAPGRGVAERARTDPALNAGAMGGGAAK